MPLFILDVHRQPFRAVSRHGIRFARSTKSIVDDAVGFARLEVRGRSSG